MPGLGALFKVGTYLAESRDFICDSLLRSINQPFVTGHGPFFLMAAPPSAYKDRHFLAVIGDEVGIYLPEVI